MLYNVFICKFSLQHALTSAQLCLLPTGFQVIVQSRAALSIHSWLFSFWSILNKNLDKNCSILGVEPRTDCDWDALAVLHPTVPLQLWWGSIGSHIGSKRSLCCCRLRFTSFPLKQTNLNFEWEQPVQRTLIGLVIFLPSYCGWELIYSWPLLHRSDPTTIKTQSHANPRDLRCI